MGFRATGGLMALGICLVTTDAAAGNDYPASGLVHHSRENSALQYDCTLKGKTLECEFAQTSVKQKNNTSGPHQQNATAPRVYFGGKGPSRQECRSYEQLLSALKKGKAPNGVGQKEFERDFAQFALVNGQDFQAVASFFSDYCSKSSPQRILKVVRPKHSTKTRTCLVSTRRFSQRFNKLPGSDIWVAMETPPGACGVVQLDRFVPDKSVTKNHLWTYFARKVISNNSVKTRSDRKCTDTIESESKFHWRPREVQLECDAISFELF